MSTNRKPKRKIDRAAIVPISLRLTKAQHEGILALAASQERTVSQELRYAVELHLADARARAAA